MTRNTSEVLPYCQHCGSYKGVGPCKNPECDPTKFVDMSSLRNESSNCIVCSKEGVHSCASCGTSYCNEHAIGKDENMLVDLDQKLGTCVICGKVICEQCWIFNNKGLVTCLVHLEVRNSD